MRTNLSRAIAVAAVAAIAQVSSALTYQFNYSFSPPTSPGSVTPWATLTFTDLLADTVGMTLSLSNLATGQFASDLFFNYGGNASPLTFAFASGTAPTPAITKGSDCCKADGDGHYDVRFAFPTSGSGDRFTAGEQITYTITGSGVSADDFAYLSTSGGGAATYYAAMHIQGIASSGGTTSAWIAPIPEPENYALMLAGLAVVGLIARRRTRRV